MKLNHILLILEPVSLFGEGEYNLNNLMEIKVSESYLGLDQAVRGCQNEEPMFNCTTRHYRDTIFNQCGCLTFSIKSSEEVYFLI